jgi:hypothetical protein
MMDHRFFTDKVWPQQFFLIDSLSSTIIPACILKFYFFGYVLLEKSKLYSSMEDIWRDFIGYTNLIEYMMTLLKLHSIQSFTPCLIDFLTSDPHPKFEFEMIMYIKESHNMLNKFINMAEVSNHHLVSLQIPLPGAQIFHMPCMCHQQWCQYVLKNNDK